jgi:predicted MFS family arabinose efflux permease
MLLSGVVIFLIGSIIPLIVPSYDALMLSRIITGFAGGIIMPQSRSKSANGRRHEQLRFSSVVTLAVGGHARASGEQPCARSSKYGAFGQSTGSQD